MRFAQGWNDELDQLQLLGNNVKVDMMVNRVDVKYSLLQGLVSS